MAKRETRAIRKDTQSRRKHRENENYSAFTKKQNTNNVVDFNQPHQVLNPQKRQQKPIELLPQSINQEKYILALTNPDTDIVVVSGPAGSGKTYLAMLAAIDAMRKGNCDKIILTRPAVSVDEEKHGFLPGDLNSKMEPWVRPLFDILREYYNAKELEYMMSEQIIEIAPLAFCRGRTFKNSWIICDEMQNASPNQCKMIMTRIGENSKIIITGDTDQTDRTFHENGLLDLKNRISKYEVFGMTACEFDHRDIRRHKIIEHVLRMYN